MASVTACAQPIAQLALVMSDGSQMGFVGETDGSEIRGWLFPMRLIRFWSESGVASRCGVVIGVAGRVALVDTHCRAGEVTCGVVLVGIRCRAVAGVACRVGVEATLCRATAVLRTREV